MENIFGLIEEEKSVCVFFLTKCPFTVIQKHIICDKLNNTSTCLWAALLLWCFPQTSWRKSELAAFIPSPHIKVAPIWRKKVIWGFYFFFVFHFQHLVWHSPLMQTECQPPVATQLMGIPHSASTVLGSSSEERPPCPSWPWLSNVQRKNIKILLRFTIRDKMIVRCTCPVPRCTQLQIHWEGWHVLHSVPDSWPSGVVIRSGRREVLWLCNLQGPEGDAKTVLESSREWNVLAKFSQHTCKSCQMR